MNTINATEKEKSAADAVVRVIQDTEGAESPREWTNLGTMACWHRRYNLGDVQPRETPDEWLKENAPEGSVVLPLYLYDHSGITMSTTPFSCPWDSGQVGFIVGNKDPKVLENYGLTGADDEMIRQRLVAEVKVYDQYMQNDVYAYVLEQHKKCGTCGHEEWEVLDSCCGFYGTDWKENGMADHLGEHVHMLDELEDE